MRSIISQRDNQKSAIKQHLRKTSNEGTTMKKQDENRVAIALGAVVISADEHDTLRDVVEFEDVEEEFEGDDELSGSVFEDEDGSLDDEDEDEYGDDSDLDGLDGLDEDEDDEDDFDEDEALDDDEDEDEDEVEYQEALAQMDLTIADADDLDISDILGQTSLGGLVSLAETDKSEISTVLTDSAVLVTIDLSTPSAFDKFRRNQLTNVMVDGFEEPVNLFSTISSKKNGYLVSPIEEILTYHSILAESGSTTLVGRTGDINDSLDFLNTSVNRATTLLAGDALGVDLDGSRSTFLMMTDEMAAALSGEEDEDEDEDEDLDPAEFEDSVLGVTDFINISSFVSVNDVEEEAVASATVHSHIAVRFPALTHRSTVSKDSVTKIANQLPKMFARFQKKHPNVALRFGVTMKSTDILRTSLGEELSSCMNGMGLTPYNYDEVNFSDAVFPLQGDSTFDASVANSVFTFGGDILYIADVQQEEDEDESE